MFAILFLDTNKEPSLRTFSNRPDWNLVRIRATQERRPHTVLKWAEKHHRMCWVVQETHYY